MIYVVFVVILRILLLLCFVVLSVISNVLVCKCNDLSFSIYDSINLCKL